MQGRSALAVQTAYEFRNSDGSTVVAGNLRGLRFWEDAGFQIARYWLVYRPDRPREPEEDD